MDAQKVDMFMMANGKYFEGHQLIALRERLLELDDSKWPLLQAANLKDPTTSLIVSIVAGNLGVDRFLIGDVGLGIVKLITCGGFGIWALIDWFMIMGATREKNMLSIQRYLM